MKIRKLFALFMVIGLVIANCYPLTVYAEETTTASTTDGGEINSTGLIESYSLSLSGSTCSIYITATTYGMETMGKIGFTNISVQRSSSGNSGWSTEYSLDDDTVKNFDVHYKSSEYHSVIGGYYYRIKLDHYAKEKGWFFPSSQSITNYSNVVWVPAG
jgi:hypothetical protein